MKTAILLGMSVLPLLALCAVQPALAATYPDLGISAEVVADGLTVPWSIDWLPDGTILFTERGGDLRAIVDGNLVPEPLVSIASSGTVEGGLLGLAVDPDFADNGYVYLYQTYKEDGIMNKIVRYHVDGGAATEDAIILDGIPGGAVRDGGRIQFGPDGMIYAAVGEGGKPERAQDADSLAGKILRIGPDGSIPADNPFEGSPVWALGLRNPQGMDWDGAGNLIVADHGQAGQDELNLITAGANYGWPDLEGDAAAPGMSGPIIHSGNETWAPSGAEFYDGDKIPQWTGKYFAAMLKGEHLRLFDIDPQSGAVTSSEALLQDEFGRLRDVQTGPDGYLYLLTSNLDGRGEPADSDDRIIRLVPASQPALALTPASPIARAEVVAGGLTVPWSIDWLPDGTILFTERGGDLRAIVDGNLVPEPLVSIASSGTVEGGLLGLAVDPDFADNGYVYLYQTYKEDGIMNKIVRYHVDGGAATEDAIILDGIPGGAVRDGGRIQFGPDGMIYAAVGEGGKPERAQDADSLAGKILRIGPDGSIPADNPFEGSPVWALGLRNPQGMDWDGAGNLIVADHGQAGQDELNLITAGANYGWPDLEGDAAAPGMSGPIIHSGNETWAPSGAEFYDGDKIPQWTGKYFAAMLKGEHLRLFDIDPQSGAVTSSEALLQDEFGRLRDVQTGPDGYLYLLTSNLDGRGEPADSDDRIIRLVPASQPADATTYPPPLRQLASGIAADDVQCNGPRELYIRGSGAPVCITQSSYDRLTGLGIDLAMPRP